MMLLASYIGEKEYMEENNLLVLSNNFLSFVKDQVESISPNFENISVFVRFNPFRGIFGYQQIINCTNTLPIIDIYKTPVYYLPLDRHYKNLGEKHYHATEKLIRKNRLTPNLIHSHFTWSSGYVGARLKEEYGLPFVVTCHGYDIYSLPFKDEEWRNKIEYVLNSADHIITVSRSNFECIQRLDVSTPVTVIPNGFMSNRFYPRDLIECRKKLNLPIDKKLILTVGNLVPIKGQKHLINSIHNIVKERDDILCMIVGAGKLRNTLKRQIHSLGLEKYIMLAGGKPHSEISLWMNACDLFVLPSLNEGNPTVLFEAMGCGIPFVGTKVGGVPEVITSDEYGLLVEPGDVEDLAERILMALDKEWNRRAILKYAEQYTWQRVAEEIVKVYKQILN